jgi:hypothetical protein
LQANFSAEYGVVSHQFGDCVHSFNPYKAYGQSKLGDILLAKEFAEILKVKFPCSSPSLIIIGAGNGI